MPENSVAFLSRLAYNTHTTEQEVSFTLAHQAQWCCRPYWGL